MSKYDNATIEILNWEKYNPRKDIKHPQWFRFTNAFFEEPQFFSFTTTDLWVLVYILSQASKKQHGVVRLSWGHAERIGRIREKDLISALDKLQHIQFVRVTLNDPYADVTDTSRARHATLHNKTEQDRTGQDTATSGEPPVIASLESVAGIELLQGVKTELQDAWVSQYDAAWICTEVRKAEAWCLANPSKRPKSSFARFMNNWLARAWESHRKTIPSQPVSGLPSPVRPKTTAADDAAWERELEEMRRQGALEAERQQREAGAI